MCTSEKSQNNLAEYREHILEDTRYINLQGIPLPLDRSGRPRPMEIPLDKVYIRIKAIEEKHRRAQEKAEERQLEKGHQPEHERKRKGYFDYIHELGEHLYRQAQIYQEPERPEAVDPLEALEKHKRMVILGAPGSGKSTLLRYVARKAVQDNTNIPILIPLREYAAVLTKDEAIPLTDFALKQMSKGNKDVHSSLKNEIEAGHALWLLDALDEAQPWGEKITRQVSQLKGSLIITSRPIGYTNVGLENLTRFEVLPLASDHIDQFLSDWFGIIAEKLDEGPDWIEEIKASFEDQLAKRPRIHPLIHNPLLLTFLVILSTYKWQDLPDRRAQLYKRYVEELLSR
jgi:predicted NACHT family NTPase